MRAETFLELTDCREYRQTLEARPPAIVHGTALLAIAALATAVVWAGFTRANLVVRAPGRIRPIDVPTQVFAAPGTRLEGRVAEVHVREGQFVNQGDVLLRFDTGRLDNDLAKTQRTIATAKEELAEFNRLSTLLDEQFATGKSKAAAELAQAVAEVERAKEKHMLEARRAEIELATAGDQEARTRRLVPTGAATESQRIETLAKLQDAEQKLRLARVPIDEGRVAVLRQALDLVERDFAVRQGELEARRVAKRGEIDAAGKELANLEREHDQATLRASVSGIVTRGIIKAGDILEPGKPVLEIARQQGFRFEVAVPSEDVGLLREGMAARIKFDAYDYQKYGTLAGRVVFISPDSNVPDDKSAANGAVYLVRLDLAGDRVERGDLVGLVKLGMTGRAEIVTSHESLLSILVRRIRSSISVG